MNQTKKTTKGFDNNISKWKEIYIVLLVSLTSGFVFFTMENWVWFYGYSLGKVLQTNGYVFEPWTFEQNIPVIPAFFYIYIIAIPFWILGFMGIYYFKGAKSCYKVLGISAFIFFITAIIYTAAPTYAGNLAVCGWKQIDGKHGVMYDTVRTMWTSGVYLSACPSQHSSCSIIIALAFLGGRDDKSFSKKNEWYRPLVTSLIWMYAILVCLSTFFLKQHFFIDWIVSLGLCCLCWILCVKYPKINVFYKIYAWLFSNFFAYCGMNEKGVQNIVAPTAKNKVFENIDKYSRRQRLWINVGYNAFIFFLLGVMMTTWILTIVFGRGIKPEPWPPTQIV